jgi:hypothetical protein
MLCVCVITTFYERLIDVFTYGLCLANEWNWFINFWNDIVMNKKKITIVTALKKPGYYNRHFF